MNRETFSRSDVVGAYEDFSLQPPEVFILLDHLEQLRDRRVLDLGCGTGRTAPFLATYASEYLGVDFAAPMVEIARSRLPGLRFEVGDATNLAAYADGSFDVVVFSFNGIDYVGHEDRLTALREAKRVLAPHGLFIFSSHNRHCSGISRHPRLALDWRPWRLARGTWDYVLALWNHQRHRRGELETPTYALINDSAHNFGLLTYYVDRGAQERQLTEQGFKCEAVYASGDGRLLKASDDDRRCAWLYYVARKAR